MTEPHRVEQPEQQAAEKQPSSFPVVDDAPHGDGILRLLDREPPADYRREWTERISVAEKDDAPATESVVIFRIGAEWLALPTRVIQEVAEPPTLHTVPHRRSGILIGLVSIRGELLLCASLSVLLGLEKAVERQNVNLPQSYERLLVIKRETSRLAFPVSEVHGVHRYRPGELQDVPATLPKGTTTYTTGLLSWQNRTVGCLDDERLFDTVDKSLS